MLETYSAMAIPYNLKKFFINDFDILRDMIVFAVENL